MVDRYTKLVLTVIAICLVWLSLGGPSLITPVKAQVGESVILAGWYDANDRFHPFPARPQTIIGGKAVPEKPNTSGPLPIWDFYR